MGYLTNRSINLLNVHFLLMTSAEVVKIFFGLAFFITEGIAVWFIALFWSIYYVVRFGSRFFAVPLIRRIGIKKGIIIGTFGEAIALLFLMFVDGINWALFCYFILSGIMGSIYWASYHSFFCVAGDQSHRGKQIAIRSVLALLASAGMPAFNGIVASIFGFAWVFVIASLVLTISVVPLLFIVAPKMPRMKLFSLVEFSHQNKWAFSLFASSAIYFWGYIMVWSMVVFLMVGDIAVFGWIVAISLLIESVLHLVLGNLLDKGKWKPMIIGGGVISILKIMSQAFFVLSPLGVIISNAFESGKTLLFDPTMDRAYYNNGRSSKDPIGFVLFGEAGWDIGSLCALWLFALLSYSGVPLQWLICLGIIGIILPGTIIYHYYQREKLHGK